MNSFLQIGIPSLEIISYGPAVPQPPVASSVSYFNSIEPLFAKTTRLLTFSSLEEKKKFGENVLIWHMNHVNYCGDPEPISKERYNNIIKKISKENPLTKFFIIDAVDIFDIDQKEFSNVQVWKRKFQFNLQVLFDEENTIHLHRKNWFVSILGRSETFRTEFYNYLLEQKYQEQNLISYGCYDMEKRTSSNVEDCHKNYLNTGGLEKYKDTIPFNNFGEVPTQLQNRLSIDHKTNNALINIVFETFANREHIFFTEKTYKCFVQGHYPLIIGAPGSMSKLAGLGFEIPDYINWHIWDHLPMDESNYGKMDIIKNQLHTLMEKYKIDDIALDYYNAAIKNQKRLLSFDELNKAEEREICRWLLTGCNQLSNPAFQQLYN